MCFAEFVRRCLLSEVCGDKIWEAASLLGVWWLERSGTRVPVGRGEVPLKKGNFIEIRRVVLLGMVILRKILACLINVTKENLKGHSMYSIILYLLISLVF
jgi:hypothetical protein